jgi:hypothetical protein
MARTKLDGGTLSISLSLPEAIFSFHGDFHIPLAHITAAYVSTLKDLQLQWRLLGTGAGSLMTGGIFTSADGIVFCDVHGGDECLVIETRDERFHRLAFTLDGGQDPHEAARSISASRS